jgi:stage II sporulation protein D
MPLSGKLYRLLIGQAVLSLILLVSCSPGLIRNIGGYDTQTVKILVMKSKEKFTISSQGTLRVYKNIPAHTDNRSKSRITFNPHSLTGPIAVEPVNEPLLLNGIPYRGSFLIKNMRGFALVVNVLKVDEYLMSVVPGEIPAGWEPEALKAQAIASRTYAYYHVSAKRNHDTVYDLDATAASQVYRGMSDEKPKTSAAVRETSGQIMVYDEKPILSYLHSTCGGKTVDDTYVWEKSHLPYLQGTRCGFCNESTKFEWESELTLDEIRNCLSKKIPAIGPINAISFKKKDDRVVEVLIHHGNGSTRINGNNFRLLFPPEKVRSLYFISKKIKNGLALKGHGWGHGVGLCQWGARGMAMHGYNCRDILKHYYTGVKITSIRNAFIASKSRNNAIYQ